MLTIVLVEFHPYTHQGLEHLLSEFTDTNSMIRLLVARAEHLYNLLNSILLPRVKKKKKSHNHISSTKGYSAKNKRFISSKQK